MKKPILSEQQKAYLKNIDYYEEQKQKERDREMFKPIYLRRDERDIRRSRLRKLFSRFFKNITR